MDEVKTSNIKTNYVKIENNATSMNAILSMLNVFFRYSIFIILYFLAAIFYNNSTQFIIYIILLIINFGTIIFLSIDLLSISKLEELLFENKSFFDTIFIKIFIGVIALTQLLHFASIMVILVMFDSAQKSINNYNDYKMNTKSDNLLYNYKLMFSIFTLSFFIFLFFILVTYTSVKIIQTIIHILLWSIEITIILYAILVDRNMLKRFNYIWGCFTIIGIALVYLFIPEQYKKNIFVVIGTILSCILLSTSAYETYISVKLLENANHLYE